MKYTEIFIVISLLITNISNSETTETNKLVILNEAKILLKETAKQYKNTLIQGLKHNDLRKALKYCNNEVVKLISKDNEKGFSIKRISLKPRNKNNYPNLYEKEILDEFNKFFASFNITNLLVSEVSELLILVINKNKTIKICINFI